MLCIHWKLYLLSTLIKVALTVNLLGRQGNVIGASLTIIFADLHHTELFLPPLQVVLSSLPQYRFFPSFVHWKGLRLSLSQEGYWQFLEDVT